MKTLRDIEGVMHERRVYTGKFQLAETNFKCVNFPVYTSMTNSIKVLNWSRILQTVYILQTGVYKHSSERHRGISAEAL